MAHGFWPGLLIALIITPHVPFMNKYLLYIIDLIYISVLVSIGLNILAGYAGQISIGHAAFYAMGAYGSAVLQEQARLPFLVTMLLAASYHGGNWLYCGLASHSPAGPVSGHGDARLWSGRAGSPADSPSRSPTAPMACQCRKQT